MGCENSALVKYVMRCNNNNNKVVINPSIPSTKISIDKEVPTVSEWLS